MNKPSTGFIGLGSQGGPMADRMLAEGYPLAVWARRSEVMDEYAAKGAQNAESVAQLGQTCDHIGICVVNDAGVAEICEQLVPAMSEGALLAIHSTILPETCEKLAARCADRGIRFLDAPVSGGGHAASDGTLTVMCGGTEEAFEQARPVLETFAGMLVHLGPAGAGQRAKIVNNALMAATMGLSHAALSCGESLGIDRAALAELVKASSGRSFAFEVYSRLPSPAAFAQGAPLLAKDVDLLTSVLRGDENADVLEAAASHFLGPATAG